MQLISQLKFDEGSFIYNYIQCMTRYGKQYSLEQLLYRSITFDDGVSSQHNAAVRVKLVSALMRAEVGQVNDSNNYRNINNLD